MTIRQLANRLRSVDPCLTLFLSMSITGAFYRIFPQYPNMVLSLLTIGSLPEKYIDIAGRVLILIGGVGALICYIRNPILRQWNTN